MKFYHCFIHDIRTNMTRQEVGEIIETLVFVFGMTFLTIMGTFTLLGVTWVAGRLFGIYGVVIGAVVLTLYLLYYFKRKEYF